jgi:predicted metal-binding membrane protein
MAQSWKLDSHYLEAWREGSFGMFRMGIDHGLFCLGCC